MNGWVIFFGGMYAMCLVGATRSRNDGDLFGTLITAVLSLLVAALAYE